MGLQSVGTPVLWAGFTLFVLLMLAIDLGVFHKQSHAVSIREATIWTVVWIVLSLAFAALVWRWFGREKALEYVTGYLIEKALSVDNLFVFLVLFSYFAVPPALQHRVLFWGIVVAILLRATFIVAGATLVQRFHFVIYVFGAFLVFTGVKLLFSGDESVEPEHNRVVKWFRRLVPMTSGYRGNHFTVVENGRRIATPLLLVLVTVEATDVVFAVDSIPAIFGVTTDPFIVYTSNIFAILGLRAMYFVLAGMMDKFHYLKIGLGLVLAFVGVKMLVESWVEIGITTSLSVVGGLLLLSVVASLLFPPSDKDEEPPTDP